MTNSKIEGKLDSRLAKLETYLFSLGKVGIAVSGGVDSMTLAYIAHRVNTQSVMFHALSAAVPKLATERVKAYSQAHGWNLKLINVGEMEDPEYVKNPVNRCYFCKSNLYQGIAEISELVIVSGTNTDDLDDFRPGLDAAKEIGVHHPYVNADIDKQGVRQLAQYFGLKDLQELPASPCLSSRVSTGIAIDENLLLLIDRAENKVSHFLKNSLKPKAVRCRILADHIAIQLDTDQKLENNADYGDGIRQLVKEVFMNQGFEEYLKFIRIEPYSRGSAFIRVKNLKA